jgi:hypothetical protein
MQTLVRLNEQPHRNPVGNKMTKGKGDDMGRIEYIGVIA